LQYGYLSTDLGHTFADVKTNRFTFLLKFGCGLKKEVCVDNLNFDGNQIEDVIFD
jgi:hypothetical protein